MDTQQPVRFLTRHRAKFFEIDPYGHLNTNFFLTYFLEHRFTGLREAIGYDLKTLGELPVAFYTNRIDIEFLRPVFADEEFEIESFTAEVQDETALVKGELRKAGGKVAARYSLGLSCVDKAAKRPCAWPHDVISRFFKE